MNKILGAFLMTTALLTGACGAASGTASAPATAAPASPVPASRAPTGTLVGIDLPDGALDSRWSADGANLVKSLTALGYQTDLRFAGNDVATQVLQVDDMIKAGSRVLVIGAVDGTMLAEPLQKAAAAGVKILAYDRLIQDSADVDFYVTFDNFTVGVLQATSIERSLDLRNQPGPFNLELFAGSPEDTNSGLFFNGAMSLLQPYIDSGKLIVPSRQTSFPDQVGTLRWDGSTAQARMGTILATSYVDRRVDAVLSPNDSISAALIDRLKAAGYYTAAKPGPVVTGQDADVQAAKSILIGEQTSTVFKDTRLLAAQAAKMVDEIVRGKAVDVNDTKQHNGVKLVPAYLVTTVLVTKDNVLAALVDSGYYQATDLQ